MTTVTAFRSRRKVLAGQLSGGSVLLVGHTLLPRNYLANPMPFRQDSTFLYYTGVRTPDAACLIAPSGMSTLYLPASDPADEIWHGRQPPMEFVARRAGMESVATLDHLGAAINELQRQKTTVHALPVADPIANARQNEWLKSQLDPREPTSGSEALLEAVIQMRLVRDADELVAMRRAAEVTASAHRLAMSATHPGVSEDAIHALIEATFKANGMTSAYPPIVTIEGEVLHGHATGRELRSGQLLLVDAGAETPEGYASDVTRTWPVNGRFEPKQADLYRAVLEAQKAALAKCTVGTPFRDVHHAAALKLTQTLVDMTLLKGDAEELVAMGAHALFFPHGVGHLIGLDVHDLELYGDHAGYSADSHRSDQFGLSYLRLDRPLLDGMVVTIEPGFYIIPSLLRSQEMRDKFDDHVNWEEAHRLAPFGGIRIEDDVFITADGPEVLTDAIPRTVAEVEAAVGIGPPPEERLSA
jgi:Xaa-Pro aminopeptidase